MPSTLESYAVAWDLLSLLVAVSPAVQESSCTEPLTVGKALPTAMTQHVVPWAPPDLSTSSFSAVQREAGSDLFDAVFSRLSALITSTKRNSPPRSERAVGSCLSVASHPSPFPSKDLPLLVTSGGAHLVKPVEIHGLEGIGH